MDLKMLRRRCLMYSPEDTSPIFSLSWPESLPSATSSGASTNRFFVERSYIIGVSPTNYYRPAAVSNVTIDSTGVTFLSGAASGYGVGFVLNNVEPGDTCYISLTKTNGDSWLVYYDSDGATLGYTRTTTSGLQIPTGAVQVLWVLSSTVQNATCSFTNLSVTKV